MVPLGYITIVRVLDIRGSSKEVRSARRQDSDVELELELGVQWPKVKDKGIRSELSERGTDCILETVVRPVLSENVVIGRRAN
jgi:hypothetical protein